MSSCLFTQKKTNTLRVVTKSYVQRKQSGTQIWTRKVGAAPPTAARRSGRQCSRSAWQLQDRCQKFIGQLVPGEQLFQAKAAGPRTALPQTVSAPRTAANANPAALSSVLLCAKHGERAAPRTAPYPRAESGGDWRLHQLMPYVGLDPTLIRQVWWARQHPLPGVAAPDRVGKERARIRRQFLGGGIYVASLMKS